jgi:hypothetical protein
MAFAKRQLFEKVAKLARSRHEAAREAFRDAGGDALLGKRA